MAGEKKISFRGTVQKAAVPCGFRECRVEICQRTALEFLRFRWSELAVAVTCVDLLTDRGIFMGGNEVKARRIEREIFLGVRIVNAGTCDEDVAVKIVITGSCD